ncbi:MAG: hypothetical protein AB7V14_02090 [Kiritimatiellia bacterium]
MKKLCMAMAAMALFVAGSVQAADEAGELVSLKSGEISFTLLQSDGVTPMSAAPIKMLATDDGRVLVEAVSDHLGQAAVALSEGRYLLNVSGRTLAVLEATAAAATTSCRVVIPDAALMVAGEEGEEGDEVAGAPVWLKPVLIGGVVVLVAGGAYAIYDNNDDDDDGDGDDGEDEGLGGAPTSDDDIDDREPPSRL